MSAIASSLSVTAGSKSREHHSLGRSLALHILPGVFILALFLAGAQLLMRAGFPPMLAIVIGAAFGLAYQVWHLYNLGKKLNGKWSLKGIVLYRSSMPVWQYFALIPLFVILAFLIDGLTKPVGTAMLSTLPWLPEWFEIRIKESIGEKGLAWFEEFTITQTTSGETLLTGAIADQSALHGLLAKIRDLNLTLISVNRIEKE